jgi:hypothetical protein
MTKKSWPWCSVRGCGFESRPAPYEICTLPTPSLSNLHPAYSLNIESLPCLPTPHAIFTLPTPPYESLPCLLPPHPIFTLSTPSTCNLYPAYRLHIKSKPCLPPPHAIFTLPTPSTCNLYPAYPLHMKSIYLYACPDFAVCLNVPILHCV